MISHGPQGERLQCLFQSLFFPLFLQIFSMTSAGYVMYDFKNVLWSCYQRELWYPVRQTTAFSLGRFKISDFVPDFYLFFQFCVRSPCLWCFLVLVQFLSSLFTVIIITFPPKLVLCSKSSQLYLYGPKSQSHCFNGLYDLYSERHPPVFRPSIPVRKNLPCWGQN